MEQEYPVPGYDIYKVNEDGEVISYFRSKRKVKSSRLRGGRSQRLQVTLGHNGHFDLHRVVMAAKLGRWPEAWEHVRHMDGNKLNNRPNNLEIGCVILNAIDDIENGTRQTNAEYIDQAIARLTALKENLQ